MIYQSSQISSASYYFVICVNVMLVLRCERVRTRAHYVCSMTLQCCCYIVCSWASPDSILSSHKSQHIFVFAATAVLTVWIGLVRGLFVRELSLADIIFTCARRSTVE